MIKRHSLQFGRSAWVTVLLISGAGLAWAVEPPAAPKAPTKELRVQMAAMHEQMAACLRSDKPVVDCRNDMMKACQAFGLGQNCGMWGSGMGMHKRGPMSGSPATAPAAESGK
jgi:hypothetical protein